MRYSQEQLTEILRLHRLWLVNDEGGVRANLFGANLSEANLSNANLSWANLSWANLSEANLFNANLSWANLSWANLSEANLFNANLSKANLSNANLSEANLSEANLSNANLSEANLSGATIDLIWERRLSILPESGSFEGWKKCRDGVLVRLRILSIARRSNSTGRKCRTEGVEVLEVIGAEYGVSLYNETIKYRVGKFVFCDKWDENRWNECGGGIHFFLTRAEAEEYQG